MLLTSTSTVLGNGGVSLSTAVSIRSSSRFMIRPFEATAAICSSVRRSLEAKSVIYDSPL
jgi:hypothetical protein